MKTKLALAVGVFYPEAVARSRSGGVLHWWLVEEPALFRWVLTTMGTLFGAFIVYGAGPKRRGVSNS